MNPGTIVRLRERHWVLLPHEDESVYWLRPLTGTSDQAVAVRRDLSALLAADLPTEQLAPASFPPPLPDDVSDAAGAFLLWQAARLTLREGASPLRSLGRIAIRPRDYQFVPLLMALGLRPVRLFIADDVGVGKTIEALLVARELWDRGEVRRLAVLCPPYLCEQWQAELTQKFNLEAVVIRSGTIARLERDKPITKTIYEHYPIQVASIDFLKSDRNRHLFLLHAPELVIVDEAHGAADSPHAAQQQRHRLLRDLASDPHRHLVLATATPHSGIETAFRSLLALLDPEFASYEAGRFTPEQVRRLAPHFVQRTRRDIEAEWREGRCFPERLAKDCPYTLSPLYRRLFEQTYVFCSEIVRSGEALAERHQRVRHWAALSLLRCVMSSPAAAEAALAARRLRLAEAADEEELDFGGYVFESSDDRTDDEQPTPPIEEAEASLPPNERARLRELGKLAAEVQASKADTKLTGLVAILHELLAEGYQPIVWCRFVATAEYVARSLAEVLPAETQVVCVTGRQADEERLARIDEIDPSRSRVLVATDCLSEGINLQEKFTAVVHYDLPWNPNRLEQREGRVDRYGQTASQVKAICLYGRDNPVDGVVLNVLVCKAREIRRALGTSVPVPVDSQSVMEAVFKALLLARMRTEHGQLTLDFGPPPEVEVLHRIWEAYAERERASRALFAHLGVRPEEVERELASADAVLGCPSDVEDFVLTAAQRLGLPVKAEKQAGVYRVPLGADVLAALPEAVRFALPERKEGCWRISFASPTPEGADYVGRNHRFVSALAVFLLEEALTRHGQATAARAGVIATRAVERPTVLWLLRIRYLLERPNHTPWFAEVVRVMGYRVSPIEWLADDEALRLLATAQPDANLSLASKRDRIRVLLADYPAHEADLRQRIEERAAALAERHRRVARAADSGSPEGLAVRAQHPVDVLGLLALEPVGGNR